MSDLIQNEWESDTTSSDTAYEDQDEFLPHSESQDNSSNEEDTYNNTVSDDYVYYILVKAQRFANVLYEMWSKGQNCQHPV